MTPTHTRIIGLSLSALVAISGCAESGDAAASAARGFTDCGDMAFNGQTCQPGQYCSEPDFGQCSNGCLSDVNCADNQVCDLSSGSPGVCMNTSNVEVPTVTYTTDPEVLACHTACEDLLGCGSITNVQFASCKAACSSDKTLATMFADCVNAGNSCETMAQCAPNETASGGPSNPITDFECQDACSDAGFFTCGGDLPALTPSEVAACTTSCGTKSATERTAMITCYDAAFHACDDNGARACFTGWL